MNGPCPPDLDARGLRCPLPVIRLARLAVDQPAGRRLLVLADDPAARADVPAWCRLKGHTVEVLEEEDHTAYLVVLGGQPNRG